MFTTPCFLPLCDICVLHLQVAIEFTTASVTSPGVDLLAKTISDRIPVPLPGDPLQLVLDLVEVGLHISNSPSMHYSNIRQRGR